MRSQLDDLGTRARETTAVPAPTRQWLERRRSQRRRHRRLVIGSGLAVVSVAAVTVMGVMVGPDDEPARTEAVATTPQPDEPATTPDQPSSTNADQGEPEDERLGEPLDERLADFESKVRAWVAESGTPGLSMAVVNRDGIVHRADVGFADRQREIPVSPGTRFHVSALQTSMNALLIATLVEEGIFEWDTAVAELVPDANLDPDITMRHLLTMSAGIALDAERRLPTGDISTDEVGPALFAAAARSENRPGQPGERFFYSSVSAAAAGYAAASAVASDGDSAHRSYLRLFDERVLEPLGMNNSTMSASEALSSGSLSRSYSIVGRELPPTDRDVDILAPAGSLKSTANDMALYLQMLLNQGVTAEGRVMVSRDSLATLWEPFLDGYAMGWWHSVDGDGVVSLGHGGDFDGFVSYSMLIPESDLGLVILANSDRAGRGLPDILEEFADAVGSS